MISAAGRQLGTRIDALQLRERALLLLACLVVLYFLVDSFGLQPVFQQQQALRQNIADQEMQLESLHVHTGQLNRADERDPAALRARARSELAELDARLESLLGGMPAPDRAASILEQVLSSEAGLSLQAVHAHSEPVTTTDIKTGKAVALTGIRRYVLELQLEGDFTATVNYLRALESLPWNFFWKRVAFEVTEYPKARVTLNLYTLGLSEG